MRRRDFGVLAFAGAGLAALAASEAQAAKAPTEWDGLVRLPSKRLRYVYLLPGADFRNYNKVKLDPTEVAFEKNYARDYNNTRRDLSGRISDKDIQKVVADAGPAADEIFANAFRDGGFQVVTEPGPDVLRVRVGVVNIHVSSPERRTAGREYGFAGEAGSATLVVEVYDSQTGAILGRAVDSRVAGDNSMMVRRNSVTNRSDFAILGRQWAKSSTNGLNELKRLSPIDANGVKKD